MSAQVPDVVSGPRVESATHVGGKASGDRALVTGGRRLTADTSERPPAAIVATLEIANVARAMSARACVARAAGAQASAAPKPVPFAD